MFTERFFVEGLAHASYLFGADGEAAVVDPKRDVDDYLAAAERHGATIVAIFETHPHADFVSGHVNLAQRTGAPIYVSEKVAAQYPHRGLKHDDVVRIGSLRVRAPNTPGYSPDSMSFFVEGGEQAIVYTGDILFVGDVGRPDLRDATADPRAMADALYETLHTVLFTLPDDTLVSPAHGAGSLCGRKIGTAPEATIGAEKQTNWANIFPNREAFTQAIAAAVTDTFHEQDETKRIRHRMSGQQQFGQLTRQSENFNREGSQSNRSGKVAFECSGLAGPKLACF